ncbi:MAG: hypothetical protein HOW71_34360 [Nonomuraea sp.]|nr:hypothetical protein [Nonomuraea sp.]NUP67254.1 hypothetical protein [Nonomuraea sp.]
MPARSNDFQAVVYFVKAHLDLDVVVTESAGLPDRTTGQTREVDVLLAAQVAGHLIASVWSAATGAARPT